MGIYGDLERKRNANYDYALEGRVRAWIEGIIGRSLGPNLRESLMDGTILCELINRLRPGTITRIHNSPQIMFRRENFGSFQNACLKLGCKDNETCVFEDVYDNKNMGLFLTNIVSLARNVQYKPGYHGPILQDAAKQAEANVTNFSDAQLKRTACMPTKYDEANMKAQKAMETGRYTAHGVVMNPQENEYHGQKGEEKSSFYGPTGGSYSGVKAQGYKQPSGGYSASSTISTSGGFKSTPYQAPSGGYSASSTTSTSGGYKSTSNQAPSGGYSASTTTSSGYKSTSYQAPSGGYSASTTTSKNTTNVQVKNTTTGSGLDKKSGGLVLNFGSKKKSSPPPPSTTTYSNSKPATTTTYSSPKPATSTVKTTYTTKSSYQSPPQQTQECQSSYGGVSNLRNKYSGGGNFNNNHVPNLGGKTVPTRPQPKQKTYIGSYQDEAMKQAEKAKAAGRYSEHGVIMNPDENEWHGQKWK